MATQTLAELEVLFSTGGISALNYAFAKVQLQMQGIVQGAASVQSAVNSSIRLATATVTGFALAGFHASAMGEMFGIQMGMLSRSIGSIFVPEFQAAIGLLRDATEWLNNLSGAQQRALAHWIEFGVVLVLAANIIPKLITLYKSLAFAIMAVNAATPGFFTSPLILALAFLAAVLLATDKWKYALIVLGTIFAISVVPQIVSGLAAITAALVGPTAGMWGMVAAANALRLAMLAIPVVALIAAADFLLKNTKALDTMKVDKGRWSNPPEFGEWGHLIEHPRDWFISQEELDKRHPERFAQKGEGRTDLTPRLGGFTSLEGAWQRLAEASIKATAGGGKTPEEETAENTGAIRRQMERTGDILKSIKPTVEGR